MNAERGRLLWWGRRSGSGKERCEKKMPCQGCIGRLATQDNGVYRGDRRQIDGD